jgi:hypothetical protein
MELKRFRLIGLMSIGGGILFLIGGAILLLSNTSTMLAIPVLALGALDLGVGIFFLARGQDTRGPG